MNNDKKWITDLGIALMVSFVSCYWITQVVGCEKERIQSNTTLKIETPSFIPNQ